MGQRVASVIVNDATNGGVPLNNADESPTIACNCDDNDVGNGGAGASARGSGALGQQKNAGPTTLWKDGVETTSKD